MIAMYSWPYKLGLNCLDKLGKVSLHLNYPDTEILFSILNYWNIKWKKSKQLTKPLSRKHFFLDFTDSSWKVVQQQLYAQFSGSPPQLVPLHPVLRSGLRFLTCYRSKLWGKFLQNSLHNMVDAIIGYLLAGRMSTSLPHRLSSTAELVSLYFTAILLLIVRAFIKMTKEMKTPVPKLCGCQWANRSKK